MALIGIDEAGRGPVFGSLFIAGVRIPEDHPLYETAKESKSTTTKQIFETARSAREDEEISIVVKELNAKLLTQSENISTLTANWMIRIACELTDGNDDVYVDSCLKDEAKFKNAFPQEEFSTIVAEHKADENYPVVSIAGCCAKYHREIHIEERNTQFSQEIGSGYPSDTTTRDFLKSYYASTGTFPDGTRLSWSTCETLREEAEQSDMADF